MQSEISLGPGLQRRELWLQFLASRTLTPGSPDETRLIAAEFDGMREATFRANLSRGFSSKYRIAIQSLLKSANLAFDDSLWLERTTELRAAKAGATLSWVYPDTDGAERLYAQLQTLYADATHYDCLRVGSAVTSTRADFKRDEDDLACEPTSRPVRLDYLTELWSRIHAGVITGRSVHLIRSVDRLVELWATVCILRSGDRATGNRIKFLISRSDDETGFDPAMGVRIVDRSLVLFSSASFQGREAARADNSSYSGWVRSGKLAHFASDYVTKAEVTATDLTEASSDDVTHVLERAHARLLARDPAASVTTYGRLDSFQKVTKVCEQMVAWSTSDPPSWLPVIA